MLTVARDDIALEPQTAAPTVKQESISINTHVQVVLSVAMACIRVPLEVLSALSALGVPQVLEICVEELPSAIALTAPGNTPL